MEPRATSPSESARTTPGEPRDDSRALTPAGRALAEWLHQFSRAVKTCRLYDASNPTVTAFRRDLTTSLTTLLEQSGPIEIGFTPEEIVFGETPLYSARSREDNLSLPFFRDGIRSMAIQPGIQPREVDALLDAVLHVTRLGSEDADLVTLLWESELDHVSVQYVSTEGDIESGGESFQDAQAAAPDSIAPWPRSSPGDAASPAPAAASGEPGAPVVDDTGRSDDRITSGETRALEASLLGLEIAADAEVERLRREHDAERAAPLSRSVLELMRACFRYANRDSDRVELRQFLPRLLHDSVNHGDWSEARECLYLLRDPSGARDPVAEFARDIARPESATSHNAWKCLDQQSPEAQETFFEFARELGPEATDWLMRGIAESQRQGLRRGLARVLAGIVAENPERLAPWLADERWYVVRNVVHILGLMDNAAPIGLLRSASKHPEFRVRREVVGALSRTPREQSRPILLEMLESADARLFGTILHHLSNGPDPVLAAKLAARIEDESFAARPEAERRAIYHGLAAVGGDDVVPLLEGQLLHGNWFHKGEEPARIAAAMCLARIGTPAAFAVLESGARSRRAEVARACEAGLAAVKPRS